MARSDDPTMDKGTLHGMFRFRNHVFHERLGWKVECRNGMERDVFDDLDPVYVVSKGKGRRIEGCWRLLPTTGAYMLKDTFPQLLGNEAAPEDPAIWELSRFAVRSSSQGLLSQGGVSAVTFEMMKQILAFAEENGIRSYVTVTSVAVERLFKRAGIPIRRFGDGKAQRVGHVLSVACWIDINDEVRQVVSRLARGASSQEAA